jgi:hypothetical protein
MGEGFICSPWYAARSLWIDDETEHANGVPDMAKQGRSHCPDVTDVTGPHSLKLDRQLHEIIQVTVAEQEPQQPALRRKHHQPGFRQLRS